MILARPPANFVAIARKKHLDADGVELSSYAIEIARQRHGFQLHLGGCEAIPDHRYDFIYLHHVFEHLVRPAQELHSLVDHLAPGGILYIEIPYQFHVIERLRYRLKRGSRQGIPTVSSFHHPYFYTPKKTFVGCSSEPGSMCCLCGLTFRDTTKHMGFASTLRGLGGGPWTACSLWAISLRQSLGVQSDSRYLSYFMSNSTLKPDDRSLGSHFEFGRNWERLLPEIDESRVEAAIRDISSFFQKDLSGLSFLDIGCGSGLSSYAAFRLGARTITSVDIDPRNVANVQRLKQRFKVDPSYHWSCEVRSIVDSLDVAELPQSDIVYAWGVLHHTGAMWDAISNSAALVNPGGYLYLMLYRDAWSAPLWRAIKRRYVRSGAGVKFLLRNAYAAAAIAGLIAKGRKLRGGS